jgi:hypothetical protein
MDNGASKHMTDNASLFTYYDNHKHSSKKVSICDGKQLDVIGSGNVQVTNGQVTNGLPRFSCPLLGGFSAHGFCPMVFYFRLRN